MPNSTKKNKEKKLLFSDLARLERKICKEKQTTSIDTTSSSNDTSCEWAPIDTSPAPIDTSQAPIDTSRAPINTNSRADIMVATPVLVHDKKETCMTPKVIYVMQHVIDWMIRGAVILGPEAVILEADKAEDAAAIAQAVADENFKAAWPKTLADYNRPYQYYANKSAVRPHAFKRNDFELKPLYLNTCGTYTLSWSPTWASNEPSGAVRGSCFCSQIC